MNKDAMYVFDRGYVDYERFDRMTDDGYFFVSRLKKNAVIREIESFSLPEDSTVLSDKNPASVSEIAIMMLFRPIMFVTAPTRQGNHSSFLNIQKG